MDPPDFVPISQSQRADGSTSSSPPAGSGAAVQIAPESEGPATATDLPSPGLNVPGSFPLDTEDPKSSRTPESSQGIDGLQSDIDRAMDGIPEDIAKAAQSIMQAASQYLPASVADTVSGFLSKGDGASASPRADENGAAEVLGHSTAAEDVDATAAAGGPGFTPTAGMSESKLAAPAQLPSIERQTEGATADDGNDSSRCTNQGSGKPAAGRVDEASTKESTTDISFVPRVTPEAMVSESIAGPKAQEQTAESLDQAQRQDGTMAKPNDHGDLPHAAIDKPEPQPSALGQSSNDASMATSERLSTTKDLDEHPMAPKAEKDQAQSVTSKDQGSMATRSTASVAASSKGGSTIPSSSSKRSLPTKSKLVDRVKGEMKILSGKLGGDKAKIEEGRKLKSGGH